MADACYGIPVDDAEAWESGGMRVRTAWIAAGVLAAVAAAALGDVARAQTTVQFATEDGGAVYADVYGAGERAVVLAHGGRWNKESWAKQARVLAAHGFEVMAIDFRGYGKSRGPGDKDPEDAPLEKDVMAAVRYLHAHGAKSVSIVGGSMGGAAAGDASIESKPGEIDRIVMLGAAPNLPAEKLKAPALFIVARNDTSGDGPRLPGIQKQYEKAPEPKKLVVLKGSAHAQALFDTEQGERVMREMLSWLEVK
ncbi:MAG: alpha/beta fold hydrolase [Terracidiphilus sp.]